MKSCGDLVSSTNDKTVRKDPFSLRLAIKVAIIIVAIAIVMAMLQGPEKLAEKHAARQEQARALREQTHTLREQSSSIPANR